MFQYTLSDYEVRHAPLSYAFELRVFRFMEALKDPKSWLFFLHAWSQEMANGMTNQYSLIINSFGFTAHLTCYSHLLFEVLTAD
jgi:hypothetical protein